LKRPLKNNNVFRLWSLKKKKSQFLQFNLAQYTQELVANRLLTQESYEEAEKKKMEDKENKLKVYFSEGNELNGLRNNLSDIKTKISEL